MDKLPLDYIYMIVTKSGAYVGISHWPLDRANQHQYDRYAPAKQGEMHEEMRAFPYRVYILDVRLGTCEHDLETKWISFVKSICDDQGLECWNTNQTKGIIDLDYCGDRWDNKVLLLYKGD